MPDLKDFYVDENKVWFTEGYWPEGVPHQIYDIEDAEIEPIYDCFMRSANKYDTWDKDAILFVLGTYVEHVTFRTLVEKSDRFATFLYNTCGVRKGDVVAIMLPNSINYIVAYLASLKIGAVAAGVNPQYMPVELLHELSIIDAKVFVMMDALYIAGPNTELPKTNVKYLISTNLLDFVTAGPGIFEAIRSKIPDFQDKVPDQGETYEIYRMKQAIDETEPMNLDDVKPEIDPWNDTAALLMTGGTTGLPKPAVLTHAGLVSAVIMLQPWVNLKTGMLTIGSLPFYHVYGLTCVLNGPLRLGMPVILFPKPPSEEDLCKVINMLDAPEGIIYTGVEMLFKRLTDFVESMGVEAFKNEYDFWKKMKYASCGAGPLHDYVRIPFEEVFCPIRVGYGLTETCSLVSITPFWGKYKNGKLGLPLPGTDWAIFPADNFDDGPICDGTKERGGFGIDYTGEICVASPDLMKGYLGEGGIKEDNLKEWNGRTWLLTGDIGYMDEDGFVEIRDRKKSLIKVAGHSVFPKEVEDIIGQHEMVSEVAVAGLPDEMRGECVKAWILLKKEYKADRDINSESLKEWCKQNMAVWKTPKYIEFISIMPVSMTGKVQRRTLQEKDMDKMTKGRAIKG
ncbi:MAG TPA: class I adenylate-forming enzyme family protein [Candidatus Lokiarchaeia archaeon]|nr:class I adenylate-forming enzyme family protein [Candidatus Lokiarchaeia archaeon]